MENNQSVSFRNSTILYRLYGTGKPVILIHGFGEDGNVWNYIAENLKTNFCLIIPDLPGSGESEILKNDNDQITIDDYAEVIIQIIKKESAHACTIIGHSMGGYITLSIADKHPELLNGFGFFHSTAFADAEEKKKDRLKSIEFIQKHDSISFLKTSVPGLFADKFKQERYDEVEKFIDSIKYFTGEALIQYSTAMINRPERVNVLKTTPLPVLFIIGEKDSAIPLEKSLQQCHLPATVYVNILPEAGHMGMFEEKESSTGFILSYLNRL
ncbi:MAG: alpha/beta hydrolase [Ginsengibacter sp.]